MLNFLTTVTEILMLCYWILAGSLALDLIAVDPAIMYSDYENPIVVAWNWSFFPIDIAFAIVGLSARFCTFSNQVKLKLEVTASSLMVVAGLMAITFWAIFGEFDAGWWGVNIWLIALGMTNLLCSQLGDADGEPNNA